jgi:hypothetical protein
MSVASMASGVAGTSMVGHRWIKMAADPTLEAGLITQGVPRVPQDPLAPHRGPLGSPSDRESVIGNALVPAPGTFGSSVRPTVAH